MKQPPKCMSFTLTFSRLGKAFNWIKCKMVKRFSLQWGFHSVSPRGKQRPQGFTTVKLLPSLSSSFHAKNTVLLTWRFNKCVVKLTSGGWVQVQQRTGRRVVAVTFHNRRSLYFFGCNTITYTCNFNTLTSHPSNILQPTCIYRPVDCDFTVVV